MKLLLDEQLPKQLKSFFPAGFEVWTVGQRDWRGIRNGTLLRLAAEAGFDALVTLDKNMGYQQNHATLPLPIVVLSAYTNRTVDLKPFILPAAELLSTGLEPGFYVVSL